MLYLIGYRSKQQWTVKIGIAVDPVRRLRQLQTGNCHRLEILYAIRTPNSRRVEQQLHRQFRHYRQSGEWFSLPQPQVNQLIEICQRLDRPPTRA